MGLYYDAFISYKHEKRDIEVAEGIQRKLESFRVPKAVRRQTGREHISHIFRDREELGLTDDLTDEIQRALDASRFLIVVCSLHTKESAWVVREISYFLRSHDKKDILTVIIEGEPKDVLPPILLAEGAEPLSADYRLPRREAAKKEFPRIAAALLGCSYDDLMQRSQQYRARRQAVILSAALAIGAIATSYLLWSHARISASLLEARTNQIRYLSNEVEALLSEDRDVTAAQLALYTVPEDRDRTPAQSWKVLEEASGAYLPQSEMNVSANIRVVGELSHVDTIQKVCENPGKDKVGTLDESGYIRVWDAKKRKDILSFQETRDVDDILLTDDMLAVGTIEDITGYSLESGRKIWSLERVAMWGFCADESASRIIAINCGEDGDLYLSAINSEDGTFYTDKKLSDMDPFFSEDAAYAGSFNNLTAAKDGKFAAFSVSVSVSAEEGEETEEPIWICDLEAGRLLKADLQLYSVGGLDFLENGSLIVRGLPDEETAEKNDAVATYASMKVIGDIAADVCCVSRDTGKVLWSSDLQYARYAALPMCAGSFVYRDSSGRQRSTVYVTDANVLQIYDANTGEKLHHYDLSDDVSFMEEVEDDDGFLDHLTVICSDGTLGFVYMDEDDVLYMELFQASDGIALSYSQTDGGTGYFIQAKDTDTVLQYAMNYSDPDFRELSGAGNDGNPLYFAVRGSDYIAVREDTGNTADKIWIEKYDRESGKCKKSFSIPADNPEVPTCLGVSADGSKVICEMSKGENIYAAYEISVADEEVTELSLPGYEGHDAVFEQDMVSYIDTSGDLCLYDIDTEKMRSLACLNQIDGSVMSLSLSPDGKYAFVSISDGTSRLLDIKKGKIIADIKTDAPDIADIISGAVAWDEEKGYFAVTAQTALYLFDLQGKELCEISYSADPAAALYFYEDTLLAAYSDGRLERYLVPAGELLETIQLDVYSEEENTDPCWWVKRDDGNICACIGDYANVIDTKEWTVMYSVPNCLAFDEEKDIFLTFNTEDGEHYAVGYYKDYTLEDLTEKCREAANNEELDATMRRRYGIN